MDSSAKNGPVDAGVVAAAAPKEKVVELEPKRNGCVGAGTAGRAAEAGWLSCCCPNRKVFAGGASEEELCPKIKLLFGAGMGAVVELLGVAKRLGAGLEVAGVLDELVMKPNVGFGAAESEQEKML